MLEPPILPGISIRLIQLITAEHFGIDPEHMRGPSRLREFAWPRQMAIALCCEFLPHKGIPTIGHYFGGRDHSTVYHAREAALDRARNDPAEAAHLAALRQAIEAHRPEPIQLELGLAA